MLLRVILLSSLLFSLAVSAQPEDRLEPWQQQILRSINDKDNQGTRPGPDQGMSLHDGRKRDVGADRAAEAAQRRFGGKVLAVQPRGDSYRVRLLLPDGRVKTVVIED